MRSPGSGEAQADAADRNDMRGDPMTASPRPAKDDDDSPHIGTLNERSLHAALKAWYAEDGDRFEVRVDGFVADIVRGDLLIEIQTGSASALRRKLATLLRRHPVRLALPIAARKTIVGSDPDGRESSGRLSPRRGKWTDVFSELVSLRELLADPNLSVDVLLIHEEEIRVPGKPRRRKNWTIGDRRLVSVLDSVTFQEPSDYLVFVPVELEEPFTTRDLSEALGRPLRTAQKIAYTLRHLGTLRTIGKRGNSFLYERNLSSVRSEGVERRSA
jgi:hypothetical protein